MPTRIICIRLFPYLIMLGGQGVAMKKNKNRLGLAFRSLLIKHSWIQLNCKVILSFISEPLMNMRVAMYPS